MRIKSASFSNIGGLIDGEIAFPADLSVVALAGANGTGKSKLLAAIASPWHSQLPPPRDPDLASSVVVTLEIEDAERNGLSRLNIENSNPALPSSLNEFSITTTRRPLSGMLWETNSNPADFALQSFSRNDAFNSKYPSLGITYIPAERTLVERHGLGIDLRKLTTEGAWQAQQDALNSFSLSGRLDDQEFEDYAIALCIAGHFPEEESEPSNDAGVTWDELLTTVNELLMPKRLLPLTRRHPDSLRIQTPNGSTHEVKDLSSGERQALIVISRVLRRRAEGGVVLVDEPDAFLHPQLSRRMIRALEKAIGHQGQLIIATHSPAILDGLAPQAIYRLTHDHQPRVMAGEEDRFDLYRSAGFRASALTQSDLLVLTEGETDARLLSLMFPELSRASITSSGGRRQVLGDLARLTNYGLPVVGVVDHDVLAPDSRSNLIIWPTADIEGLFLSDDETLAAMLELGLLKPQYTEVAAARAWLHNKVAAAETSVIAELVQHILRMSSVFKWPSPRQQGALDALKRKIQTARWPDEADFDAAVQRAQSIWDENRSNLWKLVRGKPLLSSLASELSNMRQGHALLETLVRSGLRPAGFQGFETLLDNHFQRVDRP